MSKALYIFASAALVLALCFSCNRKIDDPVNKDTRSLTFNEETIQVSWEEGGFSVSVNANFDYEVSILCDWIHEDAGKTSTAAIRYFRAD